MAETKYLPFSEYIKTIKNLDPSSLPTDIDPKSYPKSFDELGQPVYETRSGAPVGFTYRQPKSQSIVKAMGKTVADYLRNPSVDTKKLGEFAVSTVKSVYDPLERLSKGTGTVGDLNSTVANVATPAWSTSAKEGALHIFGGKSAKGVDYSLYKDAEKRLNKGEDPQKVWEETGWSKNKNGELRFEINDNDFFYKGAPKGLKYPTDYYKLGDVVEHDKLFKEYPKLSNILVSEQELKDFSGKVDFTSEGVPYIVIDRNLSRREKEDTLLHEIQHVVQVFENPNFEKQYAKNQDLYGYANQPEEVEAELPVKRLDMSWEDRKKTVPKFAEGGQVTNNREQQMNRVFADGGINTTNKKVDPVSGNEVPPGSLPEEVRDDVDAKLSSGEYVIPADVLRYYGVSFFEKLRAKAKAGLAEMESEGRIGGGDTAKGEEDLPFSVDELQSEDLPEFAKGGLAKTPDELQMLAAQPSFNPYQWSFGGTGYQTPQTPTPAQSTPTATPTQTPTATPTQTPATPATEKRESLVDRNGPTKTSAAGSQSEGALVGGDWAKDLNFADPASVMKWADEKEKGTVAGKALTVGAAALGGPLAAGIAGGLNLGNRAAQIRAAARLAQDEGNTTLASALEDKANKMLDGGFAKDIINSWATGDKFYEAAVKAKSATTTTPKPTVVSSTRPKGESIVDRGVGYTQTGTTSDGGYATRTAIGSTAPSSSPRPAARPSTSTSTTSQASRNGFQKGGLIKKPKKKP